MPNEGRSPSRELTFVPEMSGLPPKKRCGAPFLRIVVVLCVLLPGAVLSFAPRLGYAAALEPYGRGCTVRVGGFMHEEADGPEGRDGYIYEYLLAIAQFTGWKYEFIDGTLAETQKRLERGEADLVGYLRKDPELERRLAFSTLSSGSSVQCLAVKSGDGRFSYEDFRSFNGARAALVTGNPDNEKYLAYCRDNGFVTKNVMYPTYRQACDAVAAGEADILFSDNFRKNGGFQIVARFAPENFYFAVNKNNQALLEKLDDALNELSALYPSFSSDLYDKYYGAEREMPVVFTREEREYIKSSPEIVVLYDDVWPPMEYYDAQKKKFSGIVPDIIALISEKSGLKFTANGRGAAADDRAEMMKTRKNIVRSMTYDYVWAAKNGAHVTPPFAKASVVCVKKSRSSSVDSAAVLDRSYISFNARKFAPGVKRVLCQSAPDCIKAVKDGKVGCAFINAYEAGYYSSFAKYRGLYYSGVAGVTQRLSLGVSAESDPPLLSIISKTLDSLPASAVREIVRKNTEEFYQPRWSDVVYTNPAEAAAMAVFLTAVLLSLALLCCMYKIKKEQGEALARANEAKSKFLASVSHEIRTPLTTIIGINDEIAELACSGEIKAASEKIEKASRHLLSLINDVLDMSKINEGKTELRCETFDLAETVRAVGLIYADAALRQGLTFRLIPFEESLFVSADELRIKQILINLISNAIKYNRPGGVVTLRSELLAADETTAQVKFSVEDTGIGIHKENLGAIFAEFEMEERGRKAIRGTGLGLAIASKIAALMGSRINVESELDKGSRFWFVLRLRRAPSAPRASEGGIPDGRAFKGKKVIVAEDHPINAAIVRRMLEKDGVECLMAGNGKIGADIFAGSKPGEIAAVLMDIQMPVMDGYEAARAIRGMRRADAVTVPIIALTANAFDEDVKKAREAGMDEHLAKPVDPNLLRETLARYLKPPR